MKQMRWIALAMAGMVIGANAGLTHRYTFDGNVYDVIGPVDGRESGDGTYIEAPLYVSDTPSGTVVGAPSKSLEVGMNVGTKKSGFTLSSTVGLAQVGSYSLWLKADQSLSQRYAMFFPTPGLVLLQNSGTTLSGAIGTVPNVSRQTFVAPFTVGEWTHVAMTWDIANGTATAYVNGAEVWSSSTISDTINMLGGARIGTFDVPTIDRNNALANQFDGHLYDLQVYDHALTADEIKKLHSNPGSPQVDNTAANEKISAKYPWQNYSGPLRQNYFKMRAGLNNSQSVFEKTKKGTVVFVGGSITGMDWREMVMHDLCRRFPQTQFTFLNAGVGSTGSSYGAFRLDRDVLEIGRVDLLFEEAAVNDLANGRTADEQVRGMEGIVRHARTANPDMDIIMMHFACPAKIKDYNQGKTPEVISSFEKVAEHYGVPSIDMTLEITERINRGEFTWKEDIKGLHPSPFGQRLYADSIGRLLDEAWADKPAGEMTPHLMPEKLDPFCYDDGKLFPPGLATACKGFQITTNYNAEAEGGMIRAGWNELPQLIGQKPGDRFEVKFKGSAIGIMGIAGPNAGIIEYSVDGSEWAKKDLFTKWSAKLHLQMLYTLAAELDPKLEHTITVRISSERNSESLGTNCRVVYFAINGDPRSPDGISVNGLKFGGSDGTGPEQ